MEIELLVTADGSHTLLIPGKDITYHSKHGAIQESVHVFINAGLHFAMQQKNKLKIFELGFGTGLNALLTFLETQLHKIEIEYHTVENSPIESKLASQLNYPGQLGDEGLGEQLEWMHKGPFSEKLALSPNFSFTKFSQCIKEFVSPNKYDVIYFDAFTPNAQPGIWIQEVFEKVKTMMEPGGCLVTYCCKGDVRRSLMAAGFKVAKLTGPAGKREMIRAINVSL